MYRVLVFEPECSGHHLAYVRYIIEGLRRRPVRILLATTSSAERSTEFAEQLADLRAGVEILYRGREERRKALIAGSVQRAVLLMQAVRQHRPDHIFVPYADGVSQVLGALRRAVPGVMPAHAAAEAIVMRGSFAYHLKSKRRRMLAAASLRAHHAAGWSRLHFIDEIAHSSYVGAMSGGRRASLLPDPVDPYPHRDAMSARRYLGIPGERPILGCIGELTPRKGLFELLQAVALLPIADRPRLLLVGKQAPEVRAELRQPRWQQALASGELIIRDGYVDNVSLREAVLACDVICALYVEHVGSASMVIHAAAARRPVLGARYGWIERAVVRNDLGMVTEVAPLEIAKSIPAIMALARGYRASPGAIAFAEAHSVAAFQSVLLSELDARLAASPSKE